MINTANLLMEFLVGSLLNTRLVEDFQAYDKLDPLRQG